MERKPKDLCKLFLGKSLLFAVYGYVFCWAMMMTWNLDEVSEGTEVTIICENVPEGISQDDHEAGMNSTLANLAAFLE